MYHYLVRYFQLDSAKAYNEPSARLPFGFELAFPTEARVFPIPFRSLPLKPSHSISQDYQATKDLQLLTTLLFPSGSLIVSYRYSSKALTLSQRSSSKLSGWRDWPASTVA